MTRILSGIQPTGNLHIGNYLGAIHQWVDLQHKGECFFCIVDLHAITVPQDPDALRASTREMAATYVAAGIDPQKHAIFAQNNVTAHAELGWMLGCLTPLGWLNRMTQFKDKAGKQKDQASLGLYAYPVLMAADILLYKPDYVPVGDDQKQHVELARDVAGAFNRRYGREFFHLPEPLIQGLTTRVMSLRDGSKKMSKSDPSDFSRILLKDSDDEIAQKIKKAKTDPDALPGEEAGLDGRPEAKNLLSLYAALTDQSLAAATARFAGQQFSALKQELADVTITKLRPLREELARLMADHGYLDQVLRDGAAKAQEVADKHLKEIKEIIGFYQI